MFLRLPWKNAIQAELIARREITISALLEKKGISVTLADHMTRELLLARLAGIRGFAKATIDRSGEPIRIGYGMRTAERN